MPKIKFTKTAIQNVRLRATAGRSRAPSGRRYRSIPQGSDEELEGRESSESDHHDVVEC